MVNISDGLIEIEYDRLKQLYKRKYEREQHADCIKIEGSLNEIEFLLSACDGDKDVHALMVKLGLRSK